MHNLLKTKFKEAIIIREFLQTTLVVQVEQSV